MMTVTHKIDAARALAELFRVAPRVEIAHPGSNMVGTVTPEMCQIVADALEEWASRCGTEELARRGQDT